MIQPSREYCVTDPTGSIRAIGSKGGSEKNRRVLAGTKTHDEARRIGWHVYRTPHGANVGDIHPGATPEAREAARIRWNRNVAALA